MIFIRCGKIVVSQQLAIGVNFDAKIEIVVFFGIQYGINRYSAWNIGFWVAGVAAARKAVC